MSERFELPFWPSQVLADYQEKRYEAVSEALLAVLHRLKGFNLQSLDDNAQRFVDVFVKHFLYLFTQEDYVPADRHMVEFVALNPVISNVVAISCFRTTDAFIEILKEQARNLAKMLALYSARNIVPLDRRMLFDAAPGLATHWYYCFWESVRSCCAEREALQNLREHMNFRDERLGAIDNSVPYAYFGCTYVDHENDRGLKERVNQGFQAWGAAQVPIANRPDFRRIALITEKWFPGHSVDRCTSAFVEALAGEFELTLVHLGAERADLDTSLFREVRRFRIGSPIDYSALTPNAWGIAYYPDIGMNAESIFLSNLRLAPIQICGYGHPVSTFGSRIDYWLGGRDIESLADHERNYSERLVLVPGSGVAPNRPNYELHGGRAEDDAVIVNCPWLAQKINFPLLERLRRILERSQRSVRFRFFTGGSLDGNAYVPLRRYLKDVLGRSHVQVFDNMPYAEYMRLMEQGDFSLDSYPFGGYATAIDAVHLRKPLVAWAGTRFYNRSAASVLRRVGLEELVVFDGEAYEALALRLIHDEGYRNGLGERLAGVDLESALFDRDDARHVVKAFRFLVENHRRLQSEGHRRPIVIEP